MPADVSADIDGRVARAENGFVHFLNDSLVVNGDRLHEYVPRSEVRMRHAARRIMAAGEHLMESRPEASIIRKLAGIPCSLK